MDRPCRRPCRLGPAAGDRRDQEPARTLRPKPPRPVRRPATAKRRTPSRSGSPRWRASSSRRRSTRLPGLINAVRGKDCVPYPAPVPAGQQRSIEGFTAEDEKFLRTTVAPAVAATMPAVVEAMRAGGRPPTTAGPQVPYRHLRRAEPNGEGRPFNRPPLFHSSSERRGTAHRSRFRRRPMLPPWHLGFAGTGSSSETVCARFLARADSIHFDKRVMFLARLSFSTTSCQVLRSGAT